VLALALAAAVPAAAAAHAVGWKIVANGQAPSGGSELQGILSGSPTTAHRLAARLPSAEARTVLRFDYGRNVALGIFGDWGCRAKRVRIASIDRTDETLSVRLRLDPLPPGVMECEALYPTFLLASLDRTELGAPLPSHVLVSIARA
jgi:hypothetical protein